MAGVLRQVGVNADQGIARCYEFEELGVAPLLEESVVVVRYATARTGVGWGYDPIQRELLGGDSTLR
ncbi:hypothetical protein Hypma_004544 [Hypsizygus marmoreus]|uniref:Uncharacterized protein n=1 Tax=Hypsizygus marmoreus TaxID=39966 RepID=A0A369J084_HYPMA|nr:hypothetical protein Hypma_004544 [Hypsizygus marmoreus]